MSDTTREEFLSGLRVATDPLGHTCVYDADGNQIAQTFYIYGRRDITAVDYANALVLACREYARWLPVIEAAKRLREEDRRAHETFDVLESSGRIAAAQQALMAAALKEGNADG